MTLSDRYDIGSYRGKGYIHSYLVANCNPSIYASFTLKVILPCMNSKILFVPEISILLLHVTVFCIYLFSMVATLNFNCDNILVASYIKFVIIEFDNFDIVLKRM